MKTNLDPARCIKMVYYGAWVRSRQCERKRTVGEYCRQHDPKVADARAQAKAEKWKAKMTHQEREWNHARVGARLLETNPDLYSKLLND
jgi:hypothetical protein